jgi:hypothetical protein
MSIDKHSVDTSTFTDKGRQDYARDCAEIAATRTMLKSPYGNVYRLHCTDGYVDFRLTRSTYDSDEKVARYFEIPVSEVNGYVTGKTKAVLLAWLEANGVIMYDVH